MAAMPPQTAELRLTVSRTWSRRQPRGPSLSRGPMWFRDASMDAASGVRRVGTGVLPRLSDRPSSTTAISLRGVSDRPRVVALVPAWNAAAFIDGTLAALCAQTYPSFEILISVDVSSDDTAAICRAWCARDSRVRLLVQTSRQGFVGNTAALLREADTDYAFWAWHDDLVHPEYVSRLVPAMESASRPAMAFTDVEFHGFDGQSRVCAYTALDGIVDPIERGCRVLRLPDNWWVPNRGLFRPSVARQIGGFKRHARGDYKCDWPWAVHMALLGEHVRVPGVFCRKFLKPASLSGSWSRDVWSNLAVMQACVREVLAADVPATGKARLLASMPAVVTDFAVRRLRRPSQPAGSHPYARPSGGAVASVPSPK